VKVVDVDVVGFQTFEALIEAVFEFFRGYVLISSGFFGGDDDGCAVASLEGFRDDGFSAIAFGGVDKVDACVEGLLEDGGGFGLGFALFFAVLAEATAGHAHDDYIEACTAKCGCLHVLFLWILRNMYAIKIA